MISTKQILTIGMLAALAVVAASAMTFGVAFAQDQTNTQGDNNCNGAASSCRNNQINQENDAGDNTVGDVSFN